MAYYVTSSMAYYVTSSMAYYVTSSMAYGEILLVSSCMEEEEEKVGMRREV